MHITASKRNNSSNKHSLSFKMAITKKHVLTNVILGQWYKGDWKFKASQSCHYFIYDCEWAPNSKHVKFLLCSLPILHSAWKVIFLSCYDNFLLFTHMLMPLCSFNLPMNMYKKYSYFKILRFQMKSNFSIVHELV